MTFAEQILNATRAATQYQDPDDSGKLLDIRFDADTSTSRLSIRGLFPNREWDATYYTDYAGAYTQNGKTLTPDPATLAVHLIAEDGLTEDEKKRYFGRFKAVSAPEAGTNPGSVESGLKSPEIGQEWQVYAFDFTAKIETPAPILTRDDGIPVASRKTVTLIAGDKGCGKSTMSVMMQAAALSRTPFWGFERRQDNLHIIAADTEMSPEEVAARYTAVFAAAGLSATSLSKSLTVLRLRECDPRKKRSILREVCRAKKPDLVFLDVVTDFVHNFNDEVEGKEIVDEMLAISEQYDCAVVATIHTVPGVYGSKAIGHVGSAAIRKDSSYMMLKRDKNSGNIIVTNIHGRSGRFTPFSFSILKDGTPVLEQLPQEAGPSTEKEKELAPVIRRLLEVMQPGQTYEKKAIVSMLSPYFNVSNIDKYIRDAVEKGLITRVGRGLYQINDISEQS